MNELLYMISESNLMEIKILVSVEETMVPIKNEMRFRNLEASLNSQSDYLLEVTFAQWNLVWVSV